MKLRWKILIGVGILIVLMAASLSVTMHVQPESELEAYKKILRDKGEKLELSEVIPPPPAPEDNARNAVEDAFRMIGSNNQNVPNGMRMVAPGRAMVGWSQPDVWNSDFTNSWDDFGAEVGTNGPAIELLHQILVQPKLDFQLDYSKGARMLLPHLAPMKHSAQMLDAAAIYELHNGDSGAATTNIITLLTLVRKDTGDTILISHLVRIAMTAIAIAPTWELLQATNANDSQLATLQEGWQRMDFLSDAENCFVMERAWVSAEIEKSRVSHEGFKDTLGLMGSSFGSSSGGSSWPDMLENFTQGPRSAVGEGMWRSSWSYSEELRLLQSDQIILDGVRTMETNQTHFYKTNFDAMSSRLSSLGFTNTGGAMVHALKIPDLREDFGGFNFFGNALGKTLRIEAARDVVVTAIALKRFQMKHGAWPDTLGQLVPEYLPSVPMDPYDGKPLKYHPNTDGTFLLYSVGEDGLDDGGDLTPVRAYGTTTWDWQRARDWVWPQPASPAEVQYYYEHPPK
jgi:hypothetical protein